MAEALLEQVKDSLECGLCLCMQNNPKLLPCLHSFCKLCIEKLLKFNEDGSARFSCPVCVKVVVIPANQTVDDVLKNNFSMAPVLKNLRENELSEDKCKDVKCSATVNIFCETCMFKFCTDCYKAHCCDGKAATKIYYDQTINNYIILCDHHESTATTICHTCKGKFICIYCDKREHKNHRKTKMEKRAIDDKNEFKTKLSHAKEQFQKTNPQMLVKIELFRKSLRSELNERIVAKVSEYYLNLQQQADLILDEFEEALQVEKSIESYISCIESKSILELLLEGDEISKKVNGFTEAPMFHGQLVNNDSIGKFQVTRKPLNVDRTKLAGFELEMACVRESDEKLIEQVDACKQFTNGPFAKTECLIKKMNEIRETYSAEDVKEAVSNGNHEDIANIIKWKPELINEKVKVEMTIGGKNSEHLGCSMLHVAADVDGDNSSMLGMLLATELIDVDGTSDRACTPLMWASRIGNVNCAKVLLHHKSNVEKVTSNGVSALIFAAWFGQQNCLELLLQYGAKIDAQDLNGYTALIRAVQQGNFSCIKTLLLNNADVTIKSTSGETALSCAKDKKIQDLLKEHIKYQELVNTA